MPIQGKTGMQQQRSRNGTTSQYVPYAGGNGGQIFNSNGTNTNIDPAIGH